MHLYTLNSLLEKENRMTENIEIIEYSEEFAAGLAEMHNNCRKGWMSSNTETAESIIKQNRGASYLNHFLAKVDDKIAGYIRLTPFDKAENTLYVDGLAVRDDFHGKKLGKKLLLRTIEETINRGYPRLDLYTWSGNIKAVPLYKKCGFFWTNNDQAVHLINMIPEVLTIDLFKEFFTAVNWYADSIRQIDQKPDDAKDGKFELFPYEWQKDNKYLKLIYTRRGKGIKSIETEDYLIETIIEDAELIFGQTYPVKYQITNKSGKELKINLKGKSDLNIEFACNQELIVKDQEVIKAAFTVQETNEEYDIWKPHPCVIADLLVNGKKVRLRTGINPKAPLAISGSKVMWQEKFNNRKDFMIFNIENNHAERVNYQFSFYYTEKIEILEPEIDITLNSKENREIRIPYMAKTGDFFNNQLKVTAKLESGQIFTFMQNIFYEIMTENSIYFGTSKETYIGSNNLLRYWRSKGNNQTIINDARSILVGWPLKCPVWELPIQKNSVQKE